MKLSDYPTPLTDAKWVEYLSSGLKGHLLRDHAEDLERKLAMFRGAMAAMLRNSRVGYSAKNEIAKTIEQTK